MKKEVFRLLKDSSAKSRQGLMGILLTLMVIGVLLLSGPAQAVEINFVLPDTTPDENAPLTFTASVDIDTGERIPVQGLTLYIGADSCDFSVSGLKGEGEFCDEITVNRIVGAGDCDSFEYGDMYGYGYGSETGVEPYDYTNTSFGYGYGYSINPAGPCSLTYEITWTPDSVSENTEVPIRLIATTSNGGTDYVYTGTDSVTVQDVPLGEMTVSRKEADQFYSSFAGNDVVNLVVQIDGASEVTADFSSISTPEIDCGTDEGDTIDLEYNGTHWIGDCDVGDEAAVSNFVSGGVQVIASADYDEPVVGGLANGILLYNMTTFPGTGCVRFGDQSTDFSEQLDFGDINFVIDFEMNMTCQLLSLGLDLPAEPPAWMSTFEPMLLLDFESISMLTPEAAGKISNFDNYLTLQITPPGERGDSRIYINSTYLAELNTSAEITIYHLPFTSEPVIVPDADAQEYASVVWTQTDDREGSLYFSVSGFSGYDITDDNDPTIVVDTTGPAVQLSPVGINVTADGTGTPVYSVLIELLDENDGMSLYSSYGFTSGGANTANCEASDGTLEEYICTLLLDSDELPAGDYTINVTVTDFGGETGNAAYDDTAEVHVDNEAPLTTVTATTEEDVEYTSEGVNTTIYTNTENITFTAACEDAGTGVCAATLYCSDAADCTPDTEIDVGVTMQDLEEGTEYFRYSSTDSLSNEEDVVTITIYVDRTEPTITITNPADGSSHTTNPVITFTAADETSLEECRWSVNGGLTNTTVDCAGSITQTWLPGSHTVTLFAIDSAGNSASDSATFSKRISTSGGGGGSSGSGWSFTMTLTDNQLQNGFTRMLGKNQRFKFNIGGFVHYLGVTNIDGNVVYFTVWSDPIDGVLSVGESSKYDVDYDGYYDVYVKVNSVSGTQADVFVQQINEKIDETGTGEWESVPQEEVTPVEEVETPVCSPDWRCGDWSECVDKERSRVCVDNNVCGVTTGKPVENEACRVPFKLPWATILVAALIVAVLTFAVIFFLQKRYEMDD